MLIIEINSISFISEVVTTQYYFDCKSLIGNYSEVLNKILNFHEIVVKIYISTRN